MGAGEGHHSLYPDFAPFPSRELKYHVKPHILNDISPSPRIIQKFLAARVIQLTAVILYVMSLLMDHAVIDTSNASLQSAIHELAPSHRKLSSQTLRLTTSSITLIKHLLQHGSLVQNFLLMRKCNVLEEEGLALRVASLRRKAMDSS